MKKIVLFIMISCFVKFSYGHVVSDTTIKTPTNVSVSAQTYNWDYTEEEIEEYIILYEYMIDTADWDATIIAPPSVKDNCHGYAWHVSDGGAKVDIDHFTQVQKYFDDDNAS